MTDLIASMFFEVHLSNGNQAYFSDINYLLIASKVGLYSLR
jgi:hypothetical protein